MRGPGTRLGCLAVEVLVISEELWRLAVHEAGHCAMGTAFGWSPRWATIISGSALGGCSRFRMPRVRLGGVDLQPQFALLAPEVRDLFERDVMVSMAGDMAEEIFARRTGRVEETPAVRAAVLLERSPEPAVVAEAVAAVNDEKQPSDTERIARAARAAFRRDSVLRAGWLWWMQEQTRALITSQAAQVVRLAEALEGAGTLDGARIAACWHEAGRAEFGPALAGEDSPGLRKGVERNGLPKPVLLLALAEELDPRDGLRALPAPSRRDRAKALRAARNRRHRARKRGVDVPYVRPGPAPRGAGTVSHVDTG